VAGRGDSHREADAAAAAGDHNGAIGEQVISHSSPLTRSRHPLDLVKRVVLAFSFFASTLFTDG
jgi:hypothetical protein